MVILNGKEYKLLIGYKLKVMDAQDGERLTAKLVHDMYYDSCYLQRNRIIFNVI